MIHARRSRGVIFADRGWRGVLHRWRMWRNDKIKQKIKEDYERYKNGFLDNQHEIDEHWKKDMSKPKKAVDKGIPELKKAVNMDKRINWHIKNPVLEHVFWEW